MNLISTYCNAKYYNQFDTDVLLKLVQDKIDPTITNLSKEMLFAFNKILKTDPCSYWNVAVYKQTTDLLESLFQSNDSTVDIDETVFNYYLMGYNSYLQLSEIIIDIRNFNIAQETKTRLYRLPTYTSILESCISNFMRFIAILTGRSIGKDYTLQNTLGSLVQIMNSNGYTELTRNIDVNLRNAINHGKVQNKRTATGNILCFYYVENNIQKCSEKTNYEFDTIIDKAFDTASAVLLALTRFINEHLSSLNIDMSKKENIQFSLLSMKLSLPDIYCQSISDTGNNAQLNIEIEIHNTDRAYIAEIATLLAILVYDNYSGYEQYMFSFSNPRMLSGWVRYKNQEILDMISETKPFGAVLEGLISRKDFMIFEPSTEGLDLNEIKYFCFPNFSTDKYKINNIKDASINDCKRIKAHLYVGRINDKEQLMSIVNEGIEWLKTVKNPPSPTIYHKSGDMPADSIYINVYKEDTRGNKAISLNNDNFVCFVDYNVSGETTLIHGGIIESIWNSLHHEKVGNMFLAWREGKFCIRHSQKIGRNDPCPCGSGQKYKKCCGK